MKITSVLFLRRLYAELDYARHFPKTYVDRMYRKVPKKVYDNRFGAPPVIHWEIPPDDYIPSHKRPWENDEFEKYFKRSREHINAVLNSKFFRTQLRSSKRIPDEQWTIFSGDIVQIMVGPDKGKQCTVSHVIRDANAVFVDGYHRKLKDINKEQAKKLEIDVMYTWEAQPLFVDKGQVQLVDPNDNLPCETKWIVNDSKSGYDRISIRTGFKIPLPSRAFVTYEYITPEDYLEVAGKDTPADDVLEVTYQPRLATFEREIEESLGLQKREKTSKTFWY